jgi:hypothetical protein
VTVWEPRGGYAPRRTWHRAVAERGGHRGPQDTDRSDRAPGDMFAGRRRCACGPDPPAAAIQRPAQRVEARRAASVRVARRARPRGRLRLGRDARQDTPIGGTASCGVAKRPFQRGSPPGAAAACGGRRCAGRRTGTRQYASGGDRCCVCRARRLAPRVTDACWPPRRSTDTGRRRPSRCHGDVQLDRAMVGSP